MERVIGNYTSQENRSFPLDCETLEAIQNNIDMLGALGNMVGDKTILSGCQPKESGGREEGYVFLKTTAYPMGEVLHFVGSTENSDYLHLVTTNGDVTQGEITYKGAYTTRQVAQGTGAERWAWAELKEPVDIEAIAATLRKQMENYTLAYNLAKDGNLGKLPTVKLGSDEEPVLHTFKDTKELTAFVLGMQQHIQMCLESAWHEKEQIDWSIYE